MRRIAIARWLDGSGALSPLIRLRTWAQIPWLVVLTYHRIADVDQRGELDDGVIDASPAAFERQIAFLAEHFRFVTVGELLDRAARALPPPPNPVLVSFDDGYLECRSIALPILQRHGARATFFISTGPIDQRRLFWWDCIARLAGRSTRERIELDYPRRLSLPLAGRRHETAHVLRRIVQTERSLDLERYLEHLSEASGVACVPSEERALADRVLMQWSDVEALADAGMDIQSHTRSHRLLHTLDATQLGDELLGSRLDLEERLERRVEAVAYPGGYPVGHLPGVRAALDAAGYRVGFTNQTGVNNFARGLAGYGLRRIAMDASYPDAFFRSIMAVPHLAPVRSARTPVMASLSGDARTVGDHDEVASLARRDSAPLSSATRSFD